MALAGTLWSHQQHDPVRPVGPAVDQCQASGVGRSFEKIVARKALCVRQCKCKLTRLNATCHAVTPCRDRPAHYLFCFDRAHVPHPLHEIEGYGNQSKDRYQTHQDQIIRRWLEAEAECCKYKCAKCTL